LVRGDEFVDEVALGTHDLHAVVTSVLGQGGTAREVVDGLIDFLGAQRVGHEGVDGRLQRAGSHLLLVIGVAAKVQDLHGDLAAFGMHGLCHDAVVFCFVLGHQHGTALHGPGALVGGDAAGHDQAHFATCAFGVEGGHALKAVGHFFEAHVHGTHEHAVAQGGKAQVERGVQAGVVGHGVSSFYATGCANVVASSI